VDEIVAKFFRFGTTPMLRLDTNFIHNPSKLMYEEFSPEEFALDEEMNEMGEEEAEPTDEELEDDELGPEVETMDDEDAL
jgi:hypothetical protein